MGMVVVAMVVIVAMVGVLEALQSHATNRTLDRQYSNMVVHAFTTPLDKTRVAAVCKGLPRRPTLSRLLSRRSMPFHSPGGYKLPRAGIFFFAVPAAAGPMQAAAPRLFSTGTTLFFIC